jgi:hypothetical protein
MTFDEAYNYAYEASRNEPRVTYWIIYRTSDDRHDFCRYDRVTQAERDGWVVVAGTEYDPSEEEVVSR